MLILLLLDLLITRGQNNLRRAFLIVWCIYLDFICCTLKGVL